MERFTEDVVKIIKNIPAGRVMTYGQIAKLAGSPRGARQVVRILHSMSKKHNLPWHRVINAKGEIGLKEEEGVFIQKMALEEEGVAFIKNNKIDLHKYRYTPDVKDDFN
ncbi:MGMT family protein [Guptibacillus algicola]|uniref:MGMT family protein n=1 Tax=Guptibacillus algicola TaxID=225844 RepID=UPI001CD48550|nr:MGMT family protein [Alkalihalobacillus algicola]MCA0985928.1 MGMT family protein [Alkalihalobacillus algicola]